MFVFVFVFVFVFLLTAERHFALVVAFCDEVVFSSGCAGVVNHRLRELAEHLLWLAYEGRLIVFIAPFFCVVKIDFANVDGGCDGCDNGCDDGCGVLCRRKRIVFQVQSNARAVWVSVGFAS